MQDNILNRIRNIIEAKEPHMKIKLKNPKTKKGESIPPEKVSREDAEAAAGVYDVMKPLPYTKDQWRDNNRTSAGVYDVMKPLPYTKDQWRQHKKNMKKEDYTIDETLKKDTLKDYINKAKAQVTSDLYGDFGKHTPKTNRRVKGIIKAKARLLAPDELAISPERVADTRKNIEKQLLTTRVKGQKGIKLPKGMKPVQGGPTDESVELALEYFNNYFGQHLNESISDDAIMDAVYDLIGLTEAVLESVGGEWTIERARDFARKAKQERKKKYNAMSPAEQKKHDEHWDEVMRDKIEKMSR